MNENSTRVTENDFETVCTDRAVAGFVSRMRERLHEARLQGKHGWMNESPAYLSERLHQALKDGDLVSVANYAMFLHHLAYPVKPALLDAYNGAREDLAIWKKRALGAEELNRKFIAAINGHTFMGEPAPAVLNEQLLGAIARGWCHERNKHKVMDLDLACAIAEEVKSLLHAPADAQGEPPEKIKWKLVPAGVTFEVRHALEGKTGVDFLLAYADFYKGNYPAPAAAINEQMLELLKWVDKYVRCAAGEAIRSAIAAAEKAKGGV